MGDYLADLDPNQSLDWNNRDFRGLPELRDHVLAQAGLTGVCSQSDVLITAGAAEANYLAIMQLLQPGDEIEEGFAGSWDVDLAIHHGDRLMKLAAARDAAVIFGHSPEDWPTLKKAPHWFT
jgi:hypothetical protein